MRVFIQMEGESEDVYVVPGTTGFRVKERRGGTSDAAFSYRVMAKRRNFQDHRFGNDPVWGPGDTRRYGEYSAPPPIDYDANVAFQAKKKMEWRQPPLPPGFLSPARPENGAPQLPAARARKEDAATEEAR